jgi:tetratricopeptide (TPR) repeat protein
MQFIIMKTRSAFLVIYGTLVALFGCNKNALERKPTSAVLVPTSPSDFQGLLDNEDVFGWGTLLNYISADEVYISPSFMPSLANSERNAYGWEKKVFDENESVRDWNNSYTQVYYSNVVLEGLDRLLGNGGDEKWLQALRGDALFKRAIAFYHLAQIFALAYDPSTADTASGIPLRLNTDSKERIFRATMKNCYTKMLGDLEEATQLLPTSLNIAHRNRSSRPVAWALLARIYLTMGNWQQARIAGENSLQLYDSLIDFNQLDTTSRIPLAAGNREVLYPCKMSKDNKLILGLLAGGANVDTNLLKLYLPGDLRRAIYFHNRSTGTVTIKGYTGDLIPFMGINTAEIYLTVAEAHARLGNTSSALNYLNKLRQYRWKPTHFVPLIASNASEALALILDERKRELALRGQRWSDIKRLNKQGLNITLHRTIDGKTAELPPNDLRYALPIPDEVVQTNGLSQNPR